MREKGTQAVFRGGFEAREAWHVVALARDVSQRRPCNWCFVDGDQRGNFDIPMRLVEYGGQSLDDLDAATLYLIAAARGERAR